MEKIVFQPASTTCQQLQAGKISAEEVVRQFYQQIEQHNPTINAIVELKPLEKALEEARKKDAELQSGNPAGPLHGLPMTVKECYNVAGMISTNGNPKLVKNRATEDAALIQQVKAAGAIIIGKTNVPYILMDWQSTNKWYGQTNNPYSLEHVAGGSSGGSAAALAAGFTPLELGSDSGGSIRVPAHFCGICGLRPTEGALPMRGHIETPGQPRIGRFITTCGPMARNMDDLLFFTRLLWQEEQKLAEIPPVSFDYADWQPEAGLKIAYSDTLNGIELDEEYAAIYLDFIQKLHSFVPQKAHPSYDNDELIKIWGTLLGFEMRSNLGFMPFGKHLVNLFFNRLYKDPQWAGAMKLGVGATAKSYSRALDRKELVRDEFIQFFDQWDIWITPVAAMPAYPHKKAGSKHLINGKKVAYTKPFTAFNFATAVPGHPIVALPIGQTSKGLPVGVQIHAAPWADQKALKIAKFLEQFTAGFQLPDSLYS